MIYKHFTIFFTRGYFKRFDPGFLRDLGKRASSTHHEFSHIFPTLSHILYLRSFTYLFYKPLNLISHSTNLHVFSFHPIFSPINHTQKNNLHVYLYPHFIHIIFPNISLPIPPIPIHLSTFPPVQSFSPYI